MLGTNRWVMCLIASSLIAATLALPGAGAQEIIPRNPLEATPCDGQLNVTCHEGNDFCLVWSGGSCHGERPITECHARAELFCEEDDGEVCILYVRDQLDPEFPIVGQPISEPHGCLVG